MSTRTIRCLRCSKLAKVERSAPAKQWSLTYCDACYAEYAASGPAPRARKSGSSGGARAPKRVPRPRETVERGGGLYSAADPRPMWQSGLTDVDKIQEILRHKPAAEVDEVPCRHPGCDERTSFPAGADPERVRRGWCVSCWSRSQPGA